MDSARARRRRPANRGGDRPEPIRPAGSTGRAPDPVCRRRRARCLPGSDRAPRGAGSGFGTVARTCLPRRRPARRRSGHSNARHSASRHSNTGDSRSRRPHLPSTRDRRCDSSTSTGPTCLSGSPNVGPPRPSRPDRSSSAGSPGPTLPSSTWTRPLASWASGAGCRSGARIGSRLRRRSSSPIPGAIGPRSKPHSIGLRRSARGLLVPLRPAILASGASRSTSTGSSACGARKKFSWRGSARRSRRFFPDDRARGSPARGSRQPSRRRRPCLPSCASFRRMTMPRSWHPFRPGS